MSAAGTVMLMRALRMNWNARQRFMIMVGVKGQELKLVQMGKWMAVVIAPPHSFGKQIPFAFLTLASRWRRPFC